MPNPRGYHTAVVYNQGMYIFGGFDGKTRFNDLYEFKPNANAAGGKLFPASSLFLLLLSVCPELGLFPHCYTILGYTANTVHISQQNRASGQNSPFLTRKSQHSAVVMWLWCTKAACMSLADG